MFIIAISGRILNMKTGHQIALLTDFGLEDHYVGVMKAVICNISPGIKLIDVTHAIPPGDLQHAAVTLWQTKPYFQSGTIFLCVIDPGVGSERRAVIVKSGQQIFVGPDNGIFSYILEPGYIIYELTNEEYFLPNPSNTFHGRDIFAPVAAHAASGISLSKFGPPASDLIQLPEPLLEYHHPENIRGQILHADRFGNLLTSLGCFYNQDSDRKILIPWLPVGNKDAEEIPINSKLINIELPDGNLLPLVDNFAQIPRGDCGVLVGSSRLLEIVANQDNASRILNLKWGEIIRLSKRLEHKE
jgi:S-adenosylmethionine hydrolase